MRLPEFVQISRLLFRAATMAEQIACREFSVGELARKGGGVSGATVRLTALLSGSYVRVMKGIITL
jgi:hypothetical protein